MIKAIIFDIDGVLVDSKSANFISFNLALRDIFKLTISEDEDTKLDSLPSREKLKLVLSSRGVEHTEEKSKHFNKLKFEYLLQHLHLIDYNDKTTEVFQFLKNEGKKIGVVTNARGEYIHLVLDELQTKEHVDCAIGNTSGLKTKPAPDMYQAALMLLEVNESECVIFEDSEVGLAAAKAVTPNVVKINSFDQLNLEFIKEQLSIYDS